jgi:uncharacterized protein YqeY
MSLSERVSQDLKAALKAGDRERRSLLSMLQASLHNRAIEKGKQKEGLPDEEALDVLSSEAKKRKDSILEYRKAGRSDLAEKEEEELSIIKEYLPAELTREEIVSELKKILEESGISSRKEFGRVMGMAASRLKGRADGAEIKEELEKLLSE